jgi:hypothetical protein
MLESRVLLLRPWQLSPGETEPRLWIIDPQSAAALGFVCRKPVGGLLRWLPWWRSTVIAIHESGDEPLLCTLSRRPGPWASWRVRDADDHLVGQVCGFRLFDGQNALLATAHPRPEEGTTSYLGAQNRELAVTALESDGVRLTFLLGERDNPFIKMVLLAAALVHHRDFLVQAVRPAFAALGGQ